MRADLTALLSSLVAIDPVNPSLVAGGAGEARIADFVETWARDAGLEEWVSLSDTEAVARTLAGVAARLCA